MADFVKVEIIEESESAEMEQGMEEEAAGEDSGDSSDDDNDEVEISQLLEEVNTNPYQYDSHLKLITLLRQAGELEKLRKARQNMSELFPLTGELWMQWIEDELKLVNGGEGREEVMQLFDKAVKDYLAVDVWVEFCQFCVGGIGTPEGVAEARRVFEAAIMATGLHVAKGSLIWEVYREFENALLSTKQPAPGSVLSEEAQKELQDQMKRISTIFKRQLAIPLLDMEQTFCEYDQWIADIGEEIPGNAKESYQKALDMLDNYRPLEDGLLTAEAPKLTEYLSYIEYELKQGNPARIQSIYERAIEDNCLNMSLWKEYTTYLDENLKIRSVVLPVYERAVRNCPWSFSVWQGYLIALERYEEPFTLVQSVFEKALVAGFSSGTDYLQLWQTYVDYLRRRINWDEEHSDELEIFRNSIERAIVYQAKYFEAEGDPTASLQQYLAFVEGKHCQNVSRMRELWNDIMSQGFGSQAQMWTQYVNLERRYGDSKHVRKVFHRAIHSVSDWPETVFEAFLNFEREEGTLETWCSAVKRVETQMKRVTEQRNRAAEQEASWSKQQDDRKGNRQRGERRDDRNERKGGGKRAFDEPSTSAQSSKKQKRERVQEFVSGNDGSGDGRQGASTSASSSSSSSASSVFKVPQLPARRSNSSEEENPAAMDVMDEEETSEDVGEGRTQESKKAGRVSHTAFVKNLSYDVTAKRIKGIFADCGPIMDVRMICNYQNKSKGYCYVEFATEESLQKALKKDRQPIGKRPMYVDPARDSAKEPTEKKFWYETKMEKNKLFFTGLPRALTKDELEKMCNEYGKVADVRIVTFKSGISKGLAYVEFEDEASASKAIIGLDNKTLGEHTISVAISNPPARKHPSKNAPPQPQPQPERGNKSLGAKGAVGPRGKGRTQLNLVPRSLHRPKPGAGGTKPAPGVVAMDTTKPESNGEKADATETEPKPKLTNADFAKLFQK